MHVHRWALSTAEQASLFYPGLSKRQIPVFDPRIRHTIERFASVSIDQLAIPIAVATRDISLTRLRGEETAQACAIACLHQLMRLLVIKRVALGEKRPKLD